ncbi:hypothetical protein HDU76_007079, partial [Blyttiomyces sp. JEL0837]
MASQADNQNWHHLFPEVPASERLIEDFACAHRRDRGRLWISQHHLSFSSLFLAKTPQNSTSTSQTTAALSLHRPQSHFLLPISQISDLQKKSVALLFPNAIEIETVSHEKYFFSSFFERDVVVDLIKRLWDLHVDAGSPVRKYPDTSILVCSCGGKGVCESCQVQKMVALKRLREALPMPLPVLGEELSDGGDSTYLGKDSDSRRSSGGSFVGGGGASGGGVNGKVGDISIIVNEGPAHLPPRTGSSSVKRRIKMAQNGGVGGGGVSESSVSGESRTPSPNDMMEVVEVKEKEPGVISTGGLSSSAPPIHPAIGGLRSAAVGLQVSTKFGSTSSNGTTGGSIPMTPSSSTSSALEALMAGGYAVGVAASAAEGGTTPTINTGGIPMAHVGSRRPASPSTTTSSSNSGSMAVRIPTAGSNRFPPAHPPVPSTLDTSSLYNNNYNALPKGTSHAPPVLISSNRSQTNPAVSRIYVPHNNGNGNNSNTNAGNANNRPITPDLNLNMGRALTITGSGSGSLNSPITPMTPTAAANSSSSSTNPSTPHPLSQSYQHPNVAFPSPYSIASTTSSLPACGCGSRHAGMTPIHDAIYPISLERLKDRLYSRGWNVEGGGFYVTFQINKRKVRDLKMSSWMPPGVVIAATGLNGRDSRDGKDGGGGNGQQQQGQSQNSGLPVTAATNVTGPAVLMPSTGLVEADLLDMNVVGPGWYRCLEYSLPLPTPIGNRKTLCVVVEEVVGCRVDHSLCVRSITRNPGLSEGFHFEVLSCLVALGPNSTRMLVSASPLFNKFTLMKVPMTMGAIEGLRNTLSLQESALMETINSPSLFTGIPYRATLSQSQSTTSIQPIVGGTITKSSTVTTINETMGGLSDKDDAGSKSDSMIRNRNVDRLKGGNGLLSPSPLNSSIRKSKSRDIVGGPSRLNSGGGGGGGGGVSDSGTKLPNLNQIPLKDDDDSIVNAGAVAGDGSLVGGSAGGGRRVEGRQKVLRKRRSSSMSRLRSKSPGGGSINMSVDDYLAVANSVNGSFSSNDPHYQRTGGVGGTGRGYMLFGGLIEIPEVMVKPVLGVIGFGLLVLVVLDVMVLWTLLGVLERVSEVVVEVEADARSASVG